MNKPIPNDFSDTDAWRELLPPMPSIYWNTFVTPGQEPVHPKMEGDNLVALAHRLLNELDAARAKARA